MTDSPTKLRKKDLKPDKPWQEALLDALSSQRFWGTVTFRMEDGRFIPVTDIKQTFRPFDK